MCGGARVPEGGPGEATSKQTCSLGCNKNPKVDEVMENQGLGSYGRIRIPEESLEDTTGEGEAQLHLH